MIKNIRNVENKNLLFKRVWCSSNWGVLGQDQIVGIGNRIPSKKGMVWK